MRIPNEQTFACMSTLDEAQFGARCTITRRMNTVAVDDGARPLLLAEHDAVGGTSERV